MFTVASSSAGAFDLLSLDDYSDNWQDYVPVEIIKVLTQH